MTWIQTKTARFIEEEVVGVQFLASNYSRANAELIVFLRGGGEMKFSGDEANQLWEKYSGKSGDSTASD